MTSVTDSVKDFNIVKVVHFEGYHNDEIVAKLEVDCRDNMIIDRYQYHDAPSFIEYYPGLDELKRLRYEVDAAIKAIEGHIGHSG